MSTITGRSLPPKAVGNGPRSAARRPRLLLIDDDPWMRSVAGALLQEEGYSTMHAPDGQVGLLLAARAKPDAVLLDLGLPTISGQEFLRSVKDQPATRGIPILVVTAQPWLLQPSEEALCAAVLRKPFDLDDLLHAVARSIGPGGAAIHSAA